MELKPNKEILSEVLNILDSGVLGFFPQVKRGPEIKILIFIPNNLTLIVTLHNPSEPGLLNETNGENYSL